MSTGKLILNRKKHFNGMAAGLEVFINDKPCGNIASGEQCEFLLEAGTYTVSVRQNIKSGTEQLIVKSGQTSSYSIIPTPISLVSFISPLIGLGLLFLFHFPLAYTALILLPGAISSVYLLTVGKSKYFLFRQIN